MFLNVCIRILLAGLGVYIMWREGQHQPSPGVWFVVAMVLITLALVLPRRFITSAK